MSRGGRLRLVVDLLRGRPAAHVFRALDGVTLEVESRRIGRRHRRERRGQVDAAEDHRRRDQAHARDGGGERPRGRAARAGQRLPSRIHRAREHRPRGGADGPRARGDRGEARRDHRLRRHRRAHRRADQALLVGHGRAAGLRGRDHALARTSSSPTRCSPSATSRSRRNASPGSSATSTTAARSSSARTACSTSRRCAAHALWLQDGRVERYGVAADVTQAYLAYPRGEARGDPATAAGRGRVRSRGLLPAARVEIAPRRSGAPRMRRSSCAAISNRRTAARRSC